MNIRPKHIVVLLIILYVVNFHLEFCGFFEDLIVSVNLIAFFITEGLPSTDNLSNIEMHGFVAFHFYLFLMIVLLIIYYINNKTIPIFLGILILAAILIEVLNIFYMPEIDIFYPYLVFSPLILIGVYVFIFFVWWKMIVKSKVENIP